MTRPQKLDVSTIDGWLARHAGWTTENEALTKKFTFPDFASAVAFVVRVGFEAEKHDHHPDIEVGWGRAIVTWTTHDASGITSLDLTLAERCDEISP
jgi:4a-hydroxytetrahydrobiopterin dehydratase